MSLQQFGSWTFGCESVARFQNSFLRRMFAALLFCSLTVVMLSQPSHQKKADHNKSQQQAPEQNYFPPGIFTLPNTMHGEGISLVLTKFLANLQEPSLYIAANDKNTVSYRVFLVGFPQALVESVRLTIHSDGTGEFVAKKMIGNKLIYQNSSPLSSEQRDTFLHLLEQANFWALPPAERERDVLDGIDWTLEGARDGKYHVVYRHVPASNCYKQAAKYLLEDVGKLESGWLDYECPNR